MVLKTFGLTLPSGSNSTVQPQDDPDVELIEKKERKKLSVPLTSAASVLLM